MNDRPANQIAPPVSGWLQNGFHRFLGGYLRRHFHAIAVASDCRYEETVNDDEPLIVYLNHPSWWDPLLGHFLNRQLFPRRQFYAPIDADALQQYRVFAKLGFFGVQAETKTGAADFLRTSKQILAAPDTALWLTPEGRFADVRDHDATLMPGLAHVASQMSRGCVLPMAMEYVFWDERLPVCLIRQGDPIRVADFPGQTKAQWGELLSERLRQSQSELEKLSIVRSSEPFDDLIRGRQGAGVFYDTMRRFKTFITGRSFRATHGDQFADDTKETRK